MRNPQLLKQYQDLVKNQNNPQELLNNMVKNYTPEQREQFSKFANGFGINNEDLIKYGINTK